MLDKPFYLVGGSEFTDTTQSSDRRVLSEYSLTTICIVPTAAAGRGPHRAMENGIRHFTNLGARSTGAPILSRSDAHDEALISALRSADLVYFTGGSPEKIVETFRDSPALSALAEADHEKGIMIAGSSAGAMALGPRFRCPRHGWFDGLGFVDVVSVPHAESVETDVLAEIVERIGETSMILALPSGTGCLVSTHDVTPVGPEPVRAFVRGWQQLEVGVLRNDLLPLT